MAKVKESNNIKITKKFIKSLDKKTYFPHALPVFQAKLDELTRKVIEEKGITKELAEKDSYVVIANHLSEIMRAAQPFVEDAIAERKKKGEISDEAQARKTAAGNVFQQMVAYVIAQNIICGNITANVAVTMSVKSILDEYATIKVGDDCQKPDSDVIVYNPDDALTPIINYSCKTSCRERAGQTYKWKLLSDLAKCTCPHVKGNNNCLVNKYKLEYQPNRDIYMCFVTSDFYNEVAQPQIAAMFNFFDKSYLAQSTSSVKSIQTFDKVIDDINKYFS